MAIMIHPIYLYLYLSLKMEKYSPNNKCITQVNIILTDLRENDFWEKSPVDSEGTLWVKNFVKIALSRTVSEIAAFLRFLQKFKMAAKNGWKTIFGKRCWYILLIHCGAKISSKSLYLTPFLRY